jgi:hypothetical protein
VQSRPGKPALLRVVVLCCFAASTVPRAALYTHEHQGAGPGHVHAWDGSRLDDVRELIDEATHGHAHVHGAEHEHVHAGAAQQGHTAAAAAGPPRGRRASHGPGITTAAAPSTRHAHWQAPLQLVAHAAAVVARVAVLRTSAPTPARSWPAAAVRAQLRARSPPCPVSA